MLFRDMGERTTKGMKRYWDARARENAVWYVDTSQSYEEPDLDRFLESGETIVREVCDNTDVVPSGRDVALEIGSGLGRNLVALRRRFERVIGVDISSEMIAQARAFVDDPRVDFVLGDGTSLAGIDDGSVDFVMSFTVFQHIPDARIIEGYLGEVGRVLRPGGVAAFQWNNEAGHRRWVLRRWLLAFLQHTRLRPEARLRHAPQFLGSKVPLARIDRALAIGGMQRVALRQPGTLYAVAWARRT